MNFTDLTKKTKAAASVLRAVNNACRKKIVTVLMAHPGSDVQTLYKKRLKMEQSVCSQHLGILRKAGIVVATKDGKRRLYSVNEKRLAQIGYLSEELVKVE